MKTDLLSFIKTFIKESFPGPMKFNFCLSFTVREVLLRQAQNWTSQKQPCGGFMQRKQPLGQPYKCGMKCGHSCAE
jgi:hypothetical protein